MSRTILLTDEAIRAALTVDADVRAPAGLADAIRAAIEATPQRGGPWSVPAIAPRIRFVLRLAALAALLVALIAAALLLVGAPRSESAAVGTYAGGPERDGVMPGPAPPGLPAVDWGPVSVGPMGPWSPAVVDGVVYNADGRGVVVALDLATGETVWEVGVGAPVNSGISVAEGLALVGDVDGVVHALDLDDGSGHWTYDAGARMPGPPTVLDGVAYIGTGEGQFHAIDLTTGEPAWSAPVRTGGPVAHSLAAADRLVYVASAGPTADAAATLAAYDASTGEARWSQPLQAGSPGSPGVSRGLVFTTGGLDTGDEPSMASAFDRVTGAPAWAQPFVSPTGANLYRAAVANGRLFLLSNDGWAYALDAADGSLLWTAAVDPGESPNGAWVDGVLYLTGGGQDIVAMAAEDGSELWRVPLATDARAPAIVDGRIVLGTEAGTLVSLGGPSG